MRSMRNTVVVLLCLGLSIQSALGQSTLAPGKPAGVIKAQHADYAVIGVGAAAIILIAGLMMASGTYKLPSTAPTSTQP